jgi:large subunit ribosomal protein L2
VTARGIGGGHKQKIRLVDFKRNKHGVEATVTAIEYDPAGRPGWRCWNMRTAKGLHHRPQRSEGGRQADERPQAAPAELGNSLPLRCSGRLADSQYRAVPGRGAQMVRTAGGAPP